MFSKVIFSWTELLFWGVSGVSVTSVCKINPLRLSAEIRICLLSLTSFSEAGRFRLLIFMLFFAEFFRIFGLCGWVLIIEHGLFILRVLAAICISFLCLSTLWLCSISEPPIFLDEHRDMVIGFGCGVYTELLLGTGIVTTMGCVARGGLSKGCVDATRSRGPPNCTNWNTSQCGEMISLV